MTTKKDIKEKKVTLEELNTEYTQYLHKYNEAKKFVAKIEGIIEYLGNKIAEFQKDEEDDK